MSLKMLNIETYHFPTVSTAGPKFYKSMNSDSIVEFFSHFYIFLSNQAKIGNKWSYNWNDPLIGTQGPTDPFFEFHPNLEISTSGLLILTFFINSKCVRLWFPLEVWKKKFPPKTWKIGSSPFCIRTFGEIFGRQFKQFWSYMQKSL